MQRYAEVAELTSGCCDFLPGFSVEGLYCIPELVLSGCVDIGTYSRGN